MTIMVTITIEGVEHVLSPTAARRVLAELSTKLTDAERAMRETLLQPIKLDEHGRFNKLALREFFEPGATSSDAATQAGKLFNAICEASSSPRGSDILVIHADCGKQFKQQCEKTGGYHTVRNKVSANYLIDARSLIRNPNLLEGARNSGDTMAWNFHLLLSNIEL